MSQKDTLILGLGNSILSDDAAGIIIAKQVYRKAGSCNLDFAEASYAGWRLIDLLEGYRRAIIVDSIIGSGIPPGECCRIEGHDNVSIHLALSHGLGIGEAIEFARANGHRMPDTVSVYAVEVLNPYEFGEKLSCEVEDGIPEAVAQILLEEELI